MFKKVMVAVDFAGPTMELLNTVDDLKTLGMEEMIITHVVRLGPSGEGISAHRKKFLRKIEARCKEMEESGCNVRILQPVGGSPAEEIHKTSQEEDVDLIVIGSIGEGSRVRELFLGSTVNNVIRIVKKPVLIEKYERKGKKNPVRRQLFPKNKEPVVLVTTDFSKSSLRTFDFFLENRPVFKKYILFNVIDEGYTKEQIDEYRAKAAENLKSWDAEFKEKGFDVQSEIAVGVASDEISKMAEEKDVSLVAISRRGRGIINELLIGSTADPVVRHSTRPVLLLKQ